MTLAVSKVTFEAVAETETSRSPQQWKKWKKWQKVLFCFVGAGLSFSLSRLTERFASTERGFLKLTRPFENPPTPAEGRISPLPSSPTSKGRKQLIFLRKTEIISWRQRWFPTTVASERICWCRVRRTRRNREKERKTDGIDDKQWQKQRQKKRQIYKKEPGWMVIVI